MANQQLGPIDVSCDAPPYLIVQACETVGFHAPLDVRWCRLNHFIEQEERAGSHLWNLLFHRAERGIKSCSCGEALPILENYAFTFASEKVINYRLGQCPRCSTIFWEDGNVMI
jgi:hypothetical protein